MEASQRERYAAVNQPEASRRFGALTTARAEAELARTADCGLARLVLPDLIRRRRAPGRLARPALPRHPDRAQPACLSPRRTCRRRPARPNRTDR